jgi:hypothetical protein
MELKRLVKAMPWVVGVGLCLVEGLKLTFQFSAANSKIATTGHTEPFLFAPAVSRDWNYITEPQLLVLGIALTVVVLLAVLMLVLTLWSRFLDRREATFEAEAEEPAAPARRRVTPATRGNFGRAR